MIKIINWNINSIRARLIHLNELIKRHDPDIILLQEIKCIDQTFPFDQIYNSNNYNIVINGQKSYNGVAVLSKFVLEDIKYNFYGNPCPEQARFIEAACKSELGYIRVISLYVPNGGEVDSEKFNLKLKFLDNVTTYLHDVSMDEMMICGGDFNVASYALDVYSPKKLENTTCFTLHERQKIRKLINNKYFDAYRLLYPDKQEFTWWDYRAKAFDKNLGMRIDYILNNAAMVQNLTSCKICYESRAEFKTSDHAPIIATYKNQMEIFSS